MKSSCGLDLGLLYDGRVCDSQGLRRVGPSRETSASYKEETGERHRKDPKTPKRNQ